MKLLRRLQALFRRGKLDRDMAEEMRFHLEQRTQDGIGEGMTPTEAGHAARRKFGGIDQIKERVRDERRHGFIWFDQLAQDVGYTLRQLRRSPGFTIVALSTLTVGIGANAAILTLVQSFLLDPLPYDEPDQLVQVWEDAGGANAVSQGVYLDWKMQSGSFAQLAAFGTTSRNLTGSGQPERISVLRITAEGLTLLRPNMQFGRGFALGEDQSGNEKVVVLTDRFWQRRFGGDPKIVGRSIELNQEPHLVIGILPPNFLPLPQSELVIPYVLNPGMAENRGAHFLRLFGRLKPGITPEQADAELDAIAQRSAPALYPPFKRDWRALVVPLQEQLVGELRPTIYLLCGAAALVLLIGCANVANLLLARAATRQREIAVRAALGAGRGRVIRQLLTESVVLAAAGAALGIGLAFLSVDAIREILIAMNLPRAQEIALDARIIGLVTAITLVTGLLFGLVPALQAARPDLGATMKDAARGSGGPAASRFRHSLIAGEVALATIVLTGAGLLLHSFQRLASVKPGFDPRDTLAMQLSLPDQKYPGTEQRMNLFRQVAERVAALPGVGEVGLNEALPLASGNSNSYFRVAERPDIPEPGYLADYDYCTEGYFAAMGMPVVRGRLFDARDMVPEARTAVISETLARQYFAGEDPLGQHLVDGNGSWEIVGIVGDVRTRGLDRPARAVVYRTNPMGYSWRSAWLVARGTGGAAPDGEQIRRAILAIDPDQPIANLQTLEDVISNSTASRQLLLRLLGFFAVVACLLAAIGLYGVIGYTVSQRTREFGIRMALGAGRPVISRLVLRQGLVLVGAGLALGLGLAAGFSRLMESLLFEVRPNDPATFAAIALIIGAVGLVATWLPARRATRVDPMIALRCE